MKEFNLSARLGNPYCDVMAVLNQCQCPYLVIGGVAVVLHGSSRFTPDINLLVDFESDNIHNVIYACNFLGLKSETSDSLESILDPEKRWTLFQAGQPLFKVSSSQYPGFSADFLLSPIDDFSGLYERRVEMSAFNQTVPVLSLLDLIAMKIEVNRPQDQVDVTQLGVVQAIQQCQAAQAAIESLSSALPADYDRATLDNLVAFQGLNATQKLEWLMEMLAAIGGFCRVR